MSARTSFSPLATPMSPFGRRTSNASSEGSDQVQRRKRRGGEAQWPEERVPSLFEVSICSSVEEELKETRSHSPRLVFSDPDKIAEQRMATELLRMSLASGEDFYNMVISSTDETVPSPAKEDVVEETTVTGVEVISPVVEPSVTEETTTIVDTITDTSFSVSELTTSDIKQETIQENDESQPPLSPSTLYRLGREKREEQRRAKAQAKLDAEKTKKEMEEAKSAAEELEKELLNQRNELQFGEIYEAAVPETAFDRLHRCTTIASRERHLIGAAQRLKNVKAAAQAKKSLGGPVDGPMVPVETTIEESGENSEDELDKEDISSDTGADVIVSDLPYDTLRWMKKRRHELSHSKVVLSFVREKQLREMFDRLDYRGRGHLPLDELMEAIDYVIDRLKETSTQPLPSVSEASAIFDPTRKIDSSPSTQAMILDTATRFADLGPQFMEMDDNGDGTVDFEEFSRAMSGTSKSALDCASEYELECLFRHIIEFGNIRQREDALEHINRSLTVDELNTSRGLSNHIDLPPLLLSKTVTDGTSDPSKSSDLPQEDHLANYQYFKVLFGSTPEVIKAIHDEKATTEQQYRPVKDSITCGKEMAHRSERMLARFIEESAAVSSISPEKHSTYQKIHEKMRLKRIGVYQDHLESYGAIATYEERRKDRRSNNNTSSLTVSSSLPSLRTHYISSTDNISEMSDSVSVGTWGASSRIQPRGRLVHSGASVATQSNHSITSFSSKCSNGRSEKKSRRTDAQLRFIARTEAYSILHANRKNNTSTHYSKGPPFCLDETSVVSGLDDQSQFSFSAIPSEFNHYPYQEANSRDNMFSPDLFNQSCDFLATKKGTIRMPKWKPPMRESSHRSTRSLSKTISSAGLSSLSSSPSRHSNVIPKSLSATFS